MSKSAELLIFLTFNLLALIAAMPEDNKDQGPLPLLQFTDGGIRINFAGFHAQAGLGGILDGSRAGGGLHASAGTPWGAHAAAGLGGALGGDNASAGGGLYARAGLGDGLPEARAGLGGVLDGSGRSASPASGGLYAGATTGNDGRRPPPPPPGASQSPPYSPRGHTNIQIVANKGAQKGKIVSETEDVKPSTSADSYTQEKEIRRDVQPPLQGGASASAGLYGALVPDGAGGLVAAKTYQTTKVVNGVVDVTQADAPVLAPSSGAVIDNNVYAVEKPVRARWYLRKRYRSPKRQVILTPVESDAHASASAGTPLTPDTTIYTSNPGGFFDDVFNIPVSTLNAVNQLLRNNAG